MTKKSSFMKRMMSMLLILTMVLTGMPMPVYAETVSGIGLCEHHPEHTTECGYVDGQECAYALNGCEACSTKGSGQTESETAKTETEPETPMTGKTEPETTETGNAGTEPEATETGNAGTEPETTETGKTEPETIETGKAETEPETAETENAGTEPETTETGNAGTEPETTETGKAETESETTETGNTGTKLETTETGNTETESEMRETESESETESEAVCICETDDPAFHAANCPAYVAPEHPECFCVEKCTEDTLNVWCDVCGVQGVEMCQGEDASAETYDDVQAVWGPSPYELTGKGTIQDAVEAANAGGVTYIQLQCNAETSAMTFLKGTVVLDLNGYSIGPVSTGNSMWVDSDVQLTITDYSENASGSVNGDGTELVAAVTARVGTVTIQKGNFNGNGGRAVGISDNGNVIIHGGSFRDSVTKYNVITNNGNLTIYGGTIYSTSNLGAAVYTAGTATIWGGTIEGSGTHVDYRDGSLSFEHHPDPSGIVVQTSVGIDDIVLRSGYSLYDSEWKLVNSDNWESGEAYTIRPMREYVKITLWNGIEGDGSQSETAFVEQGQTFTLPSNPFTAPKDGDIFDGWNINNTNKSPGSTITVSVDTTVEAVWTRACSITFVANNGTEEQIQDSGILNTVYEFPECTFAAPTGKLFSHWDVDGKNYSPSARLILEKEDITVTAVWKDIEYEIFYDSNGANPTAGVKESIKYGQYLTLPEYDDEGMFWIPSGKGIEFECWLVNGEKKNPGDSIGPIYSDVTITAQWKYLYYQITFDANGATGSMSPVNVEAVTDARYILPENGFTAPEGMVFLGWLVNDIHWFKVGYSLPVSSDMTIKALWGGVITFDANGGTGEMESVTVRSGNSYKIPANGFTPPEGMEFSGWSMNGEIVQPGKGITITSSFTLLAQWKEIPKEAEWGNGLDSLTNSGRLKDAIAAVADGSANYIRLLNDSTVDSIRVQQGNFTLDLNGKKLKASQHTVFYLYNPSEMTIVDTGTGGELSGGSSAIVVYDNVKLNIYGGNFTGTVQAICAYGNVNIYNGSIGGNNAFQMNGGNIKIVGGTVDGTSAEFYKLQSGQDGNIILSIDKDGNGALFPNGLICYKSLNALLDEGAAYWQDGKMLTLSDDVMSLGGEVQVKEVCKHTDGSLEETGYCDTCGYCAHTWKYEVSGKTITITCEDKGCTYGGVVTLASPENLIYNGEEKNAVLTYGSWSLLEKEKPVIQYSGETDRINVTDQPIKAFITLGEGTNAARVEVEYVIEPKTLTVSGAQVKEKSYNGTTDAELTGITLTGIVGADDVSASGLAVFDNKNAGDAKNVMIEKIVLTGADAGNYTLSETSYTAEGIGKISPAPVTISVEEGQSKKYGEKEPEFTYEVTKGTLFGEDTLNVVIERTAGENAGDYEYITGTLVKGNYSVTVEAADKFKITKATPDLSEVTAVLENTLAADRVQFQGAIGVLGEALDGTYKVVEVEKSTWDEYAVKYTFTPADAYSGNYETATGTTTVLVKDTVVPSGEVSIKTDKTAGAWKEFLNTITFDLLFKETVDVTVTAADELSGIDTIAYLESAEELSLEEIKSVTDWIEMTVRTDGTASVSVPAVDAKQFVYYIRIMDKAGNVTYLSTDGATFDTQAPVINGITDGAVYYTTQKFTVTEIHPGTVTVNEQEVSVYILNGNTEAVYQVVATDLAGNSTKVTVSMKPIASLVESIEELNEDNVTGTDSEMISAAEEALASVDTEQATEEEKSEIASIQEKIDALKKVIEDTAAEVKDLEDALAEYDKDSIKSTDEEDIKKLITDLTEKLDDSNLTEEQKSDLSEALEKAQEFAEKIDADQKALEDALADQKDTTEENYTVADKTELEETVDILENIVSDEDQNYTEEEKRAAQEELDRINKLTESIERVEDSVKKMEDAVDTTSGVKAEDLPGNADAVNKLAEAKKAYEALSEKEKTMLNAASAAQFQKFTDLYEDAVYFQIIKGMDGIYTKGISNGLEFTANGAFELFAGVRVDGEMVDASNYTAKAGTTIVTLDADYLKNLKDGIHSFEIVYDVLGTQYSADCVFTVKTAVAAEQETEAETSAETEKTLESETQTSKTQTSETQTSETQTSETQTSETQTSETQTSKTQTGAEAADTGDDTNMTLWMSMMLVSALCVLWLADSRKRTLER